MRSPKAAAVRRRAVILVLDGVGIGEAPDAAEYGDAGSDTLGNVARAVGELSLPNLQNVGLGNLARSKVCRRRIRRRAAWGS